MTRRAGYLGRDRSTYGAPIEALFRTPVWPSRSNIGQRCLACGRGEYRKGARGHAVCPECAHLIMAQPQLGRSPRRAA